MLFNNSFDYSPLQYLKITCMNNMFNSTSDIFSFTILQMLPFIFSFIIKFITLQMTKINNNIKLLKQYLSIV